MEKDLKDTFYPVFSLFYYLSQNKVLFFRIS